ncbi:hypothetical protein B4U80_13507 [Leptotrombidium deliense]|uniref:Receptor ligand binding region domain-containing protein n=1 Tax=Leptotrombidium deliense TaxID=299467 RepID=A0A443S5G6_9ACAR|nr:hypothetical protein B4U80_13507 [Leptotrombidium deliense]
MKPVFEVLKRLNWSEIQFVSYDDINEEVFDTEANKNGIRVDKKYFPFGTDNCENLAEALINNSTVRVVVLQHSIELEYCLIKYMHTNTENIKFYWINIYINYTNYFKGFESTADGIISLNYDSVPNIDEITSKHAISLKAEKNDRNPLFRKYIQRRYLCDFTDDVIKKFGTTCSNVEILAFPIFVQPLVMYAITNAVFAYAHAIRDAISKRCNSTGICEDVKIMSGREFFNDYLMKVNFLGE